MCNPIYRTAIAGIISAKQHRRSPFPVIKTTHFLVITSFFVVRIKFIDRRYRNTANSKVYIIYAGTSNHFSRIQDRKEVFGHRRLLFKRRHIIFSESRINASIVIMARTSEQHKPQIRADTSSVGDVVSNRNRRRRSTGVMPVNVFYSNNSSDKRAYSRIAGTERSKIFRRFKEFFRRNNQVFRLGRNLRKLLDCIWRRRRYSFNTESGVTAVLLVIKQVSNIFIKANTIDSGSIRNFQKSNRLKVHKLHQAQIGIFTDRDPNNSGRKPRQ